MIEKFNLNEIYSTTVDGIHWEYHPNKDDILEKINELIDAVNAFEPKHGRWIEDEYGIPHCSECGTINNTVYKNYCPNCGARMDEVKVFTDEELNTYQEVIERKSIPTSVNIMNVMDGGENDI